MSSDHDLRWEQIQDTRPATANGEPRPGSTGFAYVMWQNGIVDRVRVLSRTRYGKVRYQRLTSGAIGEVDISHVRSEEEIKSTVKTQFSDHWPKDMRKWDPIRLPNVIQKQVWEKTA